MAADKPGFLDRLKKNLVSEWKHTFRNFTWDKLSEFHDEKHHFSKKFISITVGTVAGIGGFMVTAPLALALGALGGIGGKIYSRVTGKKELPGSIAADIPPTTPAAGAAETGFWAPTIISAVSAGGATYVAMTAVDAAFRAAVVPVTATIRTVFNCEADKGGGPGRTPKLAAGLQATF